jgi:hypothetical protein
MDKKYKNATLAETLGNIVGEQGIKTDVAVKIAPATVGILIVLIPVTVALGIIIAGAVQRALKI